MLVLLSFLTDPSMCSNSFMDVLCVVLVCFRVVSGDSATDGFSNLLLQVISYIGLPFSLAYMRSLSQPGGPKVLETFRSETLAFLSPESGQEKSPVSDAERTRENRRGAFRNASAVDLACLSGKVCASESFLGIPPEMVFPMLSCWSFLTQGFRSRWLTCVPFHSLVVQKFYRNFVRQRSRSSAQKAGRHLPDNQARSTVDLARLSRIRVPRTWAAQAVRFPGHVCTPLRGGCKHDLGNAPLAQPRFGHCFCSENPV